MNKKSCISFLLIIMGMVGSYIYLLYTFSSNNKVGLNMIIGIISMVTVFIGLFGVLFLFYLQLKRYGEIISDIKSYISEIKPKVDNIDENVKKVRDEIVEKIVPEMSRLEGIDLLVEDYKYRQRMKSDTFPLLSETQIRESIENVFEWNETLERELKK